MYSLKCLKKDSNKDKKDLNQSQKHIVHKILQLRKNKNNKKMEINHLKLSMIFSLDKKKFNSTKTIEKSDNKANIFLRMWAKADLIKLFIGLSLQKLHNKS